MIPDLTTCKDPECPTFGQHPRHDLGVPGARHNDWKPPAEAYPTDSKSARTQAFIQSEFQPGPEKAQSLTFSLMP